MTDLIISWELPHVLPLAGQMVGFVSNLADDSSDAPGPATHAELTELGTANVMTSQIADRPGHHKPVLDVDLPCILIPSSTPGHFHLIIDQEMHWEQYRALLIVLCGVGILEPGYVDASIERGYTSIRLPWIKKERKADPDVR